MSGTAASRRPIGVGIVGLSAAGGWAGRAHVPALTALDGIELRGLTAGSAASASAASEAFGVPGYASAEQLAAADEVDLVVVAVKVPRHRELVLPVLAAGVPVLSEWPLALDLAEAQELHRAAGRTQTFAYAAVRDDLVRGTAVAPDFAHAVRRQGLLDAIERSAATGRRVDVPLTAR